MNEKVLDCLLEDRVFVLERQLAVLELGVWPQFSQSALEEVVTVLDEEPLDSMLLDQLIPTALHKGLIELLDIAKDSFILLLFNKALVLLLQFGRDISQTMS